MSRKGKIIILVIAIVLVCAGGVFAYRVFYRQSASPGASSSNAGGTPFGAGSGVMNAQAADGIGSSAADTFSVTALKPPADPKKVKFFLDDGKGNTKVVTEGEYYDMLVAPLTREIAAGAKNGSSPSGGSEGSAPSPSGDADSDRDGLTDAEEAVRRTDPKSADTDGDGLPDGDEVKKYRTNPRTVDTDNDGLSDYDEVMVYKTNPNLKDTDGDGFSDGTEVSKGYNPLGEGKL